MRVRDTGSRALTTGARSARNFVVPAVIAQSLRRREQIPDVKFDRVFPAAQRFRSWMHWTPVDVAVRAAALLAPTPGRKVLDVGSGVGKLCLIGAAVTHATWYGIERDEEMVRTASAAAERMHVQDRTRFIHGDMASVDWSFFDSFYLFNPFGELRAFGTEDVVTRRERYSVAIDFVQHQLSRSVEGTRVVTYHGFGGDLPPSFTLAHREPAREDELCLWVRRPSRRAQRL
jgi:SAM-dependent methyltransferase